jgi:acetyl esterase/lipase
MQIYGNHGPIVAIVEGYPDPGFEQKLGCKFMEMEWTIGIARLIAASGMTAVTHSNRDPEPDALALIDHLSANGGPVGIWATSGHGPVALSAAKRAVCAVLTTPITKDFCPDTPLFVVRAGKDETPGLNAALDAFAARAIAENRPLTLVNYPDAPHSFELSVDRAETRRILQQGLDFLRAHLM